MANKFIAKQIFFLSAIYERITREVMLSQEITERISKTNRQSIQIQTLTCFI